jgi:hypothetical protein
MGAPVDQVQTVEPSVSLRARMSPEPVPT